MIRSAGPEPPRALTDDIRRELADVYLHGDGVEVGADRGDAIARIDVGSLDFIIVDRLLEQREDPVRAMRTDLATLRPGGVLFYAVRDKRFAAVEQPAGATELEDEGSPARTHGWTQADLAAVVFHCRERLGNFEVETIRRSGVENVVVLRKHGIARPRPPRPSTARRSAADRPPAPVATGIALATLREQLDAGSEAASWTVDFDGIDGRAWIVSTASPVVIALALDDPVSLRGRMALVLHDWRDGIGDVRAWVVAVDAGGRRRELWSGLLARIQDPRGLAVDCELPADTVRLEIGGESLGPAGDGTITRFALVEPHLDWSGAPSLAPLGPPPPAPVPDGPMISVLCPVNDPPLPMLTEALNSVIAQSYRNWELVLVDDGSTQPGVIAALDELGRADPRVTVIRQVRAGGIAAATNAALEHSTGEYVALLDHDDTLDPEALACVAGEIERDPKVDMVYTDEDIVLNGRPVWRHLKPDWSPDTENTNGYTCHLGVYRRELLVEVGGFRTEFDGSQDVDMILRLTERTSRVAHVPRILYHWRIHPASTAGGGSKPYAYVAARNAIAEHLQREGVDADVQFAPPGLYRVVHRVDPRTPVSIVVAADGPEPLKTAAGSWLAQPHESFTVVVAAPAGQAQRIEGALRDVGLDGSRSHVVPVDPDLDRVAGLGLAADRALAATAPAALLVMETPFLGLTDDWMGRLLGYALAPGISAAGPFVLAGDGRVAHGGVAVPCGVPLPLAYGLRPKFDDFFGRATSVYDVAALDGALMVSSETFTRMSGLDPAAGALSLVDLCLRAEAELRLRAVTIGDVRLGMLDHRPPVNDFGALRRLLDRRRRAGAADPYYNRGFRTDRGDFSPRADA